jgi:hypothetical protein
MHLKNWMEWYGLDSSGSGYRPVADSCGQGNEPSASVISWEFLNWLTNVSLKDSVPWS